MTRLTVHEYAAALRPRYQAARKGAKGRILDEFCETTGMHIAKHVLSLPQGRHPAAEPLWAAQSTEGFFLTTLTAVDVASGWTELQPYGGWGSSG